MSDDENEFFRGRHHKPDEMAKLGADSLADLDARIGPQPVPPNGADYDGAQAPPDDKPLPKLVPIRFVEGEIPKPREWIVHDGWIPTRKVTLLQGDGGDGKTPLVQQLLSSCATALPWLGLRVEECTGLGFFTEDEDRDIRLRQADIDASYGQHCASTGKMHLFPRVDEDNELVVFDNRGKPSLTPFYRQVRESALDLRARLIALDIAVDLFGGDEISRRHVRGFMRPLGALAREIDGAVVMTAHVSQAGIKSDGGHSGSTDWSNGPRGRLYLGRPKAENGEATDPNARILTRKKANFSTVGETVKLHWERGLIVPDNVTSSQFRRPIDDRIVATPAMRVGVFVCVMGQQGAARLQQFHDDRIGREHVQPFVLGQSFGIDAAIIVRSGDL